MADVNLIAQALHEGAPFVKLDLNSLTNGIILVAVGMGVRRLSAIRDHLARLNGSVGELNQWKDDHKAIHETDSLNHQRTREQCRALQGERIAHVVERMNDIAEHLRSGGKYE